MTRTILIPTIGLALLALVTGAGAYAQAGLAGTAVAVVVWLAIAYAVLGSAERPDARQRGLRR